MTGFGTRIAAVVRVAVVLCAAAISVAPAVAMTPVPPAPPLKSFGAWTIEQPPGAKDRLRLVGRSWDGAADIEVECHARSAVVGVFVPRGPAAEPAEWAEIVVWNETEQRPAAAPTARFPIRDDTTAFALVNPRIRGDGPPGAGALLSTLRRATKMFTLQVDGSTFQFDARRLKPAIAAFDTACRRLR